MSNALAVIAQNTGASEEDITAVLTGMIVSAKNQQGAKALPAEMAIVSGVCSKYGLNPLVKECAAFISGGKLSVVVMIDGWYKMVNRQPDFDGVDFEDNLNDAGEIVSITCKMYIKNRSRPVCATEYMSECRDPKSTVWKRWPNRMLRHKAYIQAARIAFGISEIIDNDEQSRIESTQPQEPKIVNVDYESIEQRMKECGSNDDLDDLCKTIRTELQADGSWQQASAKLIVMKSQQADRIREMESEIVDAEIVEFGEDDKEDE